MNNLVLEFSEKGLRVLEINQSGIIIFKEELNLNFNIYDETEQKISREEMKNEFSETIQNLLKNNKREVQTTGVLINTSQTFLNVFPLDFNEEQISIDSHLIWELSNYFPESFKNFNIKYYRLNNNELNGKIDDVLLIAVDKNKIERIKNLCNAAGLKIRNVEIDQFTVEKCLPAEYKDETECLLLLGCKNLRLDFSLIINGKLKYYDYRIIENTKFKYFLMDRINFFNSTYKEIDHIFLYGEDYSKEADIFLKNEFQNINTSFVTYDSSDDTKFAPLYGLALKNISN